ncbi:hypothetical protein FOCC_FOCC007083 [Frankliniella occidentalis]|nr:hypothetical protein FOCC_FOCC007083 [Frankliniella occidentalis]
MCDDDVAALVVDNGSGMCKAGFAARSVCGGDSPIPVARLETSILKSKWDRNESLRRDLKMFAFTVHWDYRIRLLQWDYEI